MAVLCFFFSSFLSSSSFFCNTKATIKKQSWTDKANNIIIQNTCKQRRWAISVCRATSERRLPIWAVPEVALPSSVPYLKKTCTQHMHAFYSQARDRRLIIYVLLPVLESHNLQGICPPQLPQVQRETQEEAMDQGGVRAIGHKQWLLSENGSTPIPITSLHPWNKQPSKANSPFYWKHKKTEFVKKERKKIFCQSWLPCEPHGLLAPLFPATCNAIQFQRRKREAGNLLRQTSLSCQ